MRETTEVTIRLPNETIAVMNKVSELANVPIETVFNVLMALYIAKEQS